MSKIRGVIQHKKWQEGKPLTRREAILAHCFECNGFEDGGVDCRGGKNCPLYAFFSYKG